MKDDEGRTSERLNVARPLAWKSQLESDFSVL